MSFCVFGDDICRLCKETQRSFGFGPAMNLYPYLAAIVAYAVLDPLPALAGAGVNGQSVWAWHCAGA